MHHLRQKTKRVLSLPESERAHASPQLKATITAKAKSVGRWLDTVPRAIVAIIGCSSVVILLLSALSVVLPAITDWLTPGAVTNVMVTASMTSLTSVVIAGFLLALSDIRLAELESMTQQLDIS